MEPELEKQDFFEALNLMNLVGDYSRYEYAYNSLDKSIEEWRLILLIAQIGYLSLVVFLGLKFQWSPLFVSIYLVVSATTSTVLLNQGPKWLLNVKSWIYKTPLGSLDFLQNIQETHNQLESSINHTKDKLGDTQLQTQILQHLEKKRQLVEAKEMLNYDSVVNKVVHGLETGNYNKGLKNIIKACLIRGDKKAIVSLGVSEEKLSWEKYL